MDIRTMTAADIPFGMRLKAQNHWNQLEADWQRQLDLEPNGCFIADDAGVACCCVFDAVAWVNMVLVERAQRGQGIGTALMRHVLQYLDECGVSSIRLDATALGQPVYAKLGFQADFTLERYEGILPAISTRENGGGNNITPIHLNDLASVFAFDEGITSTNRAKLLMHLIENHPECAFKYATQNGIEGYRLARAGANAWQIGPIQGSPVAGAALLFDAAAQFAGQRVYLDVPTANREATALARSLGLTVQRSFLRMTRGVRIDERLEFFWSSFGPEKG